MTDAELLDYAHYHSRTDRALFSKEHAIRLCQLSGREDMLPQITGAFIAIHADVCDRLIAAAREKVQP